jgi:porphobilinogen synthase
MKTKAQIKSRPRRNRASETIRQLVRETYLVPGDLIFPMFVTEGKNQKKPITSMPGQFRWSIDLLIEEAKKAHKLGISAVALFPVIEENKKDVYAKESVNPNGLLQRCIQELKKKVPKLTVIADVAMDPYSSDGHDGLVQGGEILNDETLEILSAMAVAQAKAGADLVAPSDMMDGRVASIRRALDENDFQKVGIISYAAKYASAFYGPFREALDSAPKAGDKKTYQMDPANVREALREVQLDVAEGADIIMVKPGLPYLDVIAKVRAAIKLPVAVYQVSGEYSMIQAAAEKGWVDGDQTMMESLMAMKRAGADMILTYFAIRAAELLQKRD